STPSLLYEKVKEYRLVLDGHCVGFVLPSRECVALVLVFSKIIAHGEGSVVLARIFNGTKSSKNLLKGASLVFDKQIGSVGFRGHHKPLEEDCAPHLPTAPDPLDLCSGFPVNGCRWGIAPVFSQCVNQVKTGVVRLQG